MSVIAVTGGTGFVGGHLLRLATETGHTIRALTRRDQPEMQHVQWIAGSLGEHTSLAHLVEGAEAVIHIAGAINAPDRDGFAAANIQGTRAVADAAQKAGASRFVHVSSLAAREPEISNYGWSKAEAEQVIRATSLDWTIIRPPAVYGPDDTETFALFKMAQRGHVALPPPGRISLIHVEDLCRLLLASLGAQESVHSIYEPDDGTHNGLSHRAFAQALGRALGKKSVRTYSMPLRIVRLAARLERLVRGSRAKLTPDRARYFCHPDWVANDNYRPPESLWTPEIPFEQGLADTALWYREAGWLP
ncbi:NAD-dependent epimerase/dehydratase family protein [Parasphingopyxis marina]|uniref:NAD(P)H-binding protein n=1 Tax=Parasphingopyxis marina TaxID=2761622 RepID=A0A842HV97_9SPHN|nr:NAD(P)H-binding protein [Parasphingopyxis marina]MBC2777006.1 NAD(P)H-binding protein [Parasphingopyxis marina]